MNKNKGLEVMIAEIRKASRGADTLIRNKAVYLRDVLSILRKHWFQQGDESECPYEDGYVAGLREGKTEFIQKQDSIRETLEKMRRNICLIPRVAILSDEPKINLKTVLHFIDYELSTEKSQNQDCKIEAINIIFDGALSTGRFIEVETDDGRSIDVGKWVERGDGRWVLRITELPIKELEDESYDEDDIKMLVRTDRYCAATRSENQGLRIQERKEWQKTVKDAFEFGWGCRDEAGSSTNKVMKQEWENYASTFAFPIKK